MKSGTVTVSRAAATAVASQAGKFIIQLGSILILSRLLSPSDFGIYATVLAIAGIGVLLSDFGLSLAALQGEPPSERERSALTSLNCIVGLATGALLAAMSPLLASAFGEAALGSVCVIIAPAFLLIGLGAQARVDLIRNSRVAAVGIVEVSASVVALVSAMAGALAGYGAASLGLQQLAYALLSTSGYILILWRESRRSVRDAGAYGVATYGMPKLTFKLGAARRYLRFSSYTASTQALNYASTNIDTLALGASLGARETGIYSRAYQLFTLPIQQLVAPVTRVILPRWSDLARTQLDELKHRIFAAMSFAGYTVGGCYAFIIVTSPMMISIVLGKAWDSAGSITAILAVGGAIQAVGYVYYWALLACGRASTLIRLETPGRLLMLCGIVLAARSSVTAVALVHTAGIITICITTMVGSRKHVRLSARDIADAIGRPFAMWSACCLACALLQAVYVASPGAELIATIAIFCAVLGMTALTSRAVRCDLVTNTRRVAALIRKP